MNILAVVLVLLTSAPRCIYSQRLQVGMTLVRNASVHGAYCLDGSLPAYHLHRGFGAGARNWLLQFEGGGWCNDLQSCLERAQTRRGSTRYMNKLEDFNGILSNNASLNPDFYNWNRVKLRYCDGASFAGDSKFDNGTSLLYFRGQRIWQAIILDLLPKGLQDAEKALLSGCSAGGLASFLHCDNFTSFLPKNASVKCLSDAGFFLDARDVSLNHTMRSFYEDLVSLQGVEQNLDKNCTSSLYYPNQCFFPQYALEFIRTPFFILNSAYDVYQFHHILVPPSADVHGHWKRCKLDPAACNSVQIAILQAFRHEMLEALKLFFIFSNRGGMFINSCFAHCQSESQDTWLAVDSPRVRNKIPKKKYGRGSMDSLTSWWGRLTEETRQLVIDAGFGKLATDTITRRPGPTLVLALAERWWDTTHTFHIAGREYTMTPYDFYRLTGLRMRGRRFTFELTEADRKALTLRLLGVPCPSATLKYPALLAAYSQRGQDTAEDRTQMARAFILYLLGAFLVANSAQTVEPGWLLALEDLTTAREYGWGSAVLSHLYATMDSLSRLVSDPTGCWRLWGLWAREYLTLEPLMDGDEASHIVVREFLDRLDRVNARPWVGAPELGPQDWEEDAREMAEISCLLSYPRARAFYFAERVVPQLTIDPELRQRVPYDPPSFSLIPYSMSTADVEEWREGIHYLSRLLGPSESYSTFARERLMPRLVGHQVPFAGAPGEGFPPVFPSWSVPLFRRSGRVREVRIQRDMTAYPCPIPPGTRQLTLPETEFVYQMIGGLKQLCIDQSQTILELRGGAGRGGGGDTDSDDDDDDGDGDEESVMQPPRGRGGASSSSAQRR